MRIEILLDKEHKISQSTLDALESELLKHLPLNTLNGIPYLQEQY